MKYKICKYVNGTNGHTWRVKYKFKWFPIWFTYVDKWGFPEEYYSRDDAINQVYKLKQYELASNIKRINCEIV